MKKISILSLFLFCISFFSFADTIKIVTTTTDMKSIAEFIGGNKVSVTSIATGYQNPHFVDASEGVNLLQVPTTANRSEGDIHIYGNPHYWLDPLNGKTIARNIANGLERVDPSNKAFYEANLVAFNNKIDLKLKEWQGKMAAYKGSKIIAYHNEWVYFETRFGLQIVDFMQPKPGIPPTPSQLVKVIKEVTANKIKLITSSHWFTTSSSDVVAKQTGVKELTLATSVGAFDPVKDYFGLFDYNIDHLITVLK